MQGVPSEGSLCIAGSHRGGAIGIRMGNGPQGTSPPEDPPLPRCFLCRWALQGKDLPAPCTAGFFVATCLAYRSRGVAHLLNTGQWSIQLRFQSFCCKEVLLLDSCRFNLASVGGHPRGSLDRQVRAPTLAGMANANGAKTRLAWRGISTVGSRMSCTEATDRDIL